MRHRADEASSPPHLASGRRAETLALRHLRRRSLRLVERNYRCRPGELDLVMLDAETLVIVEVRYRASVAYGTAAETIDARKRRRLIRATMAYLAGHPQHARRPVRFDVVQICGRGAAARLEWIRDAFRVDG